MTLSMNTKTGLSLAAALGLALGAPALAQNGGAGDEGLAAASLAEGDADRAISMLESQLAQYPGDPALLINLGIAHAQNGDEAKARSHFEAALTSGEIVELEIANGRTTDSRRLARQAIVMLERGEFRPQGQSDQLSLRN
jgi:Flp pilus assembly protein TadD